MKRTLQKMKKLPFDIELPKISETIDTKNIQQRILRDLQYQPNLSFNRLWNKQGESNTFAYHLRVLEKKGLVRKTNKGEYSLTTNGKKHVAYISEEDGSFCEFPVVAVITIIFDKNKVLLTHRTKEPFYGYWGLHGGKLRSKNYILEQARESILKETGLSCNVCLKGLFSSKTYINNAFAFNHQLFIIQATNPKGKLIVKTKKGVNKWFVKKEISKLHILPNAPTLVAIAQGKKFRWVEADRFQDDKGCNEMKIRSDVTL